MKHIDSIYWAVLFTDIKNYTLKTSLLTKLQIIDFLSKQEEIIRPITIKYFWKIIKSIWDSYMIVFENPENSVKAAIEIQNEIREYNKTIKFNLRKIELRISIDYWIVEREISNNRLDIFWNTVNISSRIQSITKENKIYVTKNVIDNIEDRNKIKYINLWKNTFKWILYEIDIYEIINQETKEKINKKRILKNTKYLKIDTDIIKNKEINKLIYNFSLVWWLIWLQNIAIIDNYLLIFLHLYMLIEISSKHWIKIISDYYKEIIITMITSFFVSYFIIKISNSFIILDNWVLLILLFLINTIITYIIWKIIDLYFYKKSKTVKAKNRELKYLFKQ